MKKNNSLLFLALALLVLSLTACGSPLLVNPEISCIGKTCTVTVENKENRNVSYGLRVSTETQGAKMTPVFDPKYVNEKRFVRWQRPNSTIFSTNDNLVAKGINTYVFDIPESILNAPGQTLFTVHVKTEAPNGLSTKYGEYVAYTTKGSQESVDVKYTVRCDNGTLNLEIEVPDESVLGDRTYAVYTNENLKDPITYIQVRSGDMQRVVMPFAADVKLFQVTVYGHADSYNEDRRDFHYTRGYCVPQKNK